MKIVIFEDSMKKHKLKNDTLNGRELQRFFYLSYQTLDFQKYILIKDLLKLKMVV